MTSPLLSIFMPAIRQNNWDKMYDSISLSCKKHSWELVLCSPFNLTNYLKTKENVKLVKDFGSPSRCAMLSAWESTGRLLFHCVDDAIFLEDAIDKAIEFYNEKCSYNDSINMKYREGQNYSGNSMPEAYWTAWFHGDLRLPGIPQHYKISLHHLLDRNRFFELGGYSCQYEYQNHNLHQFIFQLQYNGGKVFDSPVDVSSCDHSQKDHRVIEEAHEQHDRPLFIKTFSDPKALENLPLPDLNECLDQPPIWTRRFKRIPTSYEELVEK